MNFLTRLLQRVVGVTPYDGPDLPWPVRVPPQSPLHNNDETEALVRTAALSLNDPDVYGYLLLTVVRTGDATLDIQLQGQIEPSWWPALNETLERISAVSPT